MPKHRKRNWPLLAGSGIVLFFVLVALLAPLLAPYDPHEMGIPYLKPCAEHLLGTNDVGQDIFSELIYGTRVSMLIGCFTAVIVTVLATGLALLAGYYGSWVDRVVTALTNITMALPNLALTVLLVAYLNPGKLSVIIAISLTAWTGTTRILRARVAQLSQLPFVKIEKALGVRDGVILVKHLIPNLKDIILTRAALAVSSAMMSEAGLSFLGLGDPTTWSWGTVLKRAWSQNAVISSPNPWWWWLVPSLCIAVYVICFNLLGTALNDCLNPKGRE